MKRGNESVKWMRTRKKFLVAQMARMAQILDDLKKTVKTLFDVCSSCQSLCAKCYGFGFESELSRQSHNT